MTRLEQFFYDNAGYGYDPKIETEEQGRTRGAEALAKAAHYALEEGWTCEWEEDRFDMEEKAEACILRREDGYPLASLCGITGATDAYRRVVEAELALEAMHLKEAR